MKGKGNNIQDPCIRPVQSVQWWDRNCRTHVQTECVGGAAKTKAPETQIAVASGIDPMRVPAEPTVTDAPAHNEVTQRDLSRRDMGKRDPGEVSMPYYIYWLIYPLTTCYLTPACSCEIRSAQPSISVSKTLIFTTYTSKSASNFSTRYHPSSGSSWLGTYIEHVHKY